MSATALASIVTHNDFDGLGSAALLSWAYDIEDIRFAGPMTIAQAEIPVTRADIVCDLPYPLECGMWFDHHPGNLAELELRHIAPQSIPGRFAPAPSCVRVVYDFLAEQDELPADFAELARAADLIDSFGFATMDEWRADTPANRVDRALKASSAESREHYEFLREVTLLLRDLPLLEVAAQPVIIERAAHYARQEETMLEHIRKYARLLPEDAAGEVVYMDLTSFMNPVRIDKKLIGLIHPQALAYVEMKPVFRGRQKTNDLSVSISLSLAAQHSPRRKDVAEIVRQLNIGDGHAGAAAGICRCASAHEFRTAREQLPHRILDLWRRQQ
jgi:hypothetical protein